MHKSQQSSSISSASFSSLFQVPSSEQEWYAVAAFCHIAAFHF